MEKTGHGTLLFIRIWSLISVFHFFKKATNWDIPAIVIIILGVLGFVYPGRWRVFVCLLLTTIGYWFFKMPIIDNHLYIMGFISLAVLTAAVLALLRKRPVLEGIETSVPVVRIILLTAYAFAALAKYNTDFFYPQDSCAVTMTYDSLRMFSFIPFIKNVQLPVFFTNALPTVVTLIETLVPLLFLVGKTRYWGVLLLIIFHFLISFSFTATAMDFTMMLIAIVLIFFPIEVRVRIDEQISKPFIGFTSGKIATVTAALLLLVAGQYFVKQPVLLALIKASRWLIMLGALSVMAYFVMKIATQYKQSLNSIRLFSNIPAYQYLIIILVCLNALAPYLGGKTVGSFVMYSNLRTGFDNNNHMFIPRLKVKTSQDDLVEILSSENKRLQYYAENRMVTTYHELRRELSKTPNSSVSFVRSGEENTYAKASENSELIKTHWFWHKFVGHKAFYKSTHEPCSW